MTGLGNVFDTAATDADQPRGPDLEVEVEVPRSALGRDGGFDAEVPAELVHAGELVPRYVEPGEPADRVRLHLSAAMPAKARLRLRGSGGVVEGGRPGDLFVTVTIVEDPPRRVALVWWLVLAAILAAGLVAAIR